MLAGSATARAQAEGGVLGRTAASSAANSDQAEDASAARHTPALAGVANHDPTSPATIDEDAQFQALLAKESTCLRCNRVDMEAILYLETCDHRICRPCIQLVLNCDRLDYGARTTCPPPVKVETRIKLFKPNPAPGLVPWIVLPELMVNWSPAALYWPAAPAVPFVSERVP